MNLYETLGVAKDATADTIRRAYRKAAKAAHPDCGGSVEKFGQLKLAHDILTNDGRRERYDRTGKAEEAEPDDRVSAGMQMAMSAVDAVLSAIPADAPAWSVDVIAEACRVVREQMVGIKQHVAKNESAIARIEKVAKRFKVKKGKAPFLQQAMAAKVGSIRDDIRLAKMHIDRLEVALGLLTDHTYDTTPEVVTTSAQSWTVPSFFDMINGVGSVI